MNHDSESDDLSATGAVPGGDSLGHTDGQAPPPRALEPDHVYAALSDPRRRFVCYLLGTEEERSLTEIATKLAAREHDVAECEVSEEQRRRVFVSLYHTHVPKLEAEGVVEFDQVTERVTTGRNADEVIAALEAIGETVQGGRSGAPGEPR